VYKEERNKKMSGNFGYMGRSNLWGDLDHMVDVITCAIFGDCRLRGVVVVRGENAPSPIYLTRRPLSLTTLVSGHVYYRVTV